MKKINLLIIALVLGNSTYYMLVAGNCTLYENTGAARVILETGYEQDKVTGKWYKYTTYCEIPTTCVATQYRCLVQPCFCNACRFTKSSFLFANENINYSIKYDRNLTVRVDDDVIIDVYEIGTGKTLIKDVIINKNIEVALNGIEKNKHYMIHFKRLDEIIKQQMFFINNNQLFEGGKYEK